MAAGAALLPAVVVTTSTLIAAPAEPAAPIDGAEVFFGIDPVRLLDTRDGTGTGTVGPLGAGETRRVTVAGRDGVPAGATSVAINVTLPRAATETSFVTVWPAGTPRPGTSVSNATPGLAVPNFALSELGTGGALDVFNESGDTHVVIDVVGHYVALDSVLDGADGAGATVGTGSPPVSTGQPGDVYLDEDGGDLYVRSSTEWVLVVDPGHDVDARVIARAGAPSTVVGLDGDVYLDTTGPRMYGPKTGGSWGVGASIGPDGDGIAFTTGAVAPSDTTGSVGDMHLDTSTLLLYGPRTSSGWGAGVALDAGAGGTDFLTGSGAPSVSLGADGDTYLDLSALELFGPKTGGAWGSSVSIGTGPELLTGSGAPSVSLGADGDTYLDLSALSMYGPKSGGTWGSPTALNPVDVLPGASVYADPDLGVSLSIGASEFAVPFPDDGVTVGAGLTRIDDDTLQVTRAGTYRIDLRLVAASLALLGARDVEIRVGGVATPETYRLASSGVAVGGSTLVHADVGDTIEVVSGRPAIALSISLGGSLVVQMVESD